MSDDTEDQVKINALRVDAIYSHVTIPVIVMLCAALGMVITLWDERNVHALLGWFIALIIITYIRYLIVAKYHASKKLPEQYSYWLNIYLLGTFVSAIVWGTTAYVLPAENNLIELGFITMLMLIVISGSIGIYSVFRRVYYTLCLPAIVPLILFLLFQNNEQLNKLGIITIIFTVFIFIIQYHSHRIINQLLVSKYDNKTLIDNYVRDRDRINILERLNNTRTKELKEVKGRLKQSNNLITTIKERL